MRIKEDPKLLHCIKKETISKLRQHNQTVNPFSLSKLAIIHHSVPHPARNRTAARRVQDVCAPSAPSPGIPPPCAPKRAHAKGPRPFPAAAAADAASRSCQVPVFFLCPNDDGGKSVELRSVLPPGRRLSDYVSVYYVINTN